MGYTDKVGRKAVGAAAVSVIALIAGCGPAMAQAAGAADAREFSVGQGPLADALRAVSLRTGVPVIFSESVVAGRATSGVTGYLGTEAALVELLRGTGLEAVPGAGGFVIRVQATGNGAVPAQTGPARAPQPERVPGPSRAGALDEETDLRIDRVTVTGTSLRGIAPESSPLQIYSREEILGSGVTTTEQFIRTLPQNFGGGSTEFAGRLPNDTNSQRNDTLGTGANLRGLGAGATLTLLNGSRMAPASGIGDFVDLSMIPMLAIERVEVLTDGASAVYGGDAVAGVVNFVLRDDFDGAETSLRYGTVTRGDMDETRIGQTVGRSWAGGNLLGTFEHYQRGNLLLSDRPAIPPPTLQSGQPISNTGTFDLLPKQRRNSGILSLRQAFGPRIEVQANGLYSRRHVNNTQVNSIGSNYVGNTRGTAEAAVLNLAGDLAVSDSWVVTAEASYSEMRNRFTTRVLEPVATPGDDFRTVSDMWSAGLRASGDLFELPGGSVAAAIGTQYREETILSEVVGVAAGRDGRREVAALFGEVQVPLVGDANARPFLERLEVNLSGRIDDYSDFGRTSNPRIGVLWSPGGDFRARGSYSTSYAPPALGLTGAIDRGGGVISYDYVRGLLGIPLPDPSLAGVNYLSTSGTSAGLEPETSRAYSLGFDQVVELGNHSFRASATWYDIAFEGRLGATPIPGNLNANFAPGLAFADPDLFPPGTII
ncbi:MAG: TonB-dependent receptor domain-containing protein, partial [Brevundimonas sp.]